MVVVSLFTVMLLGSSYIAGFFVLVQNHNATKLEDKQNGVSRLLANAMNIVFASSRLHAGDLVGYRRSSVAALEHGPVVNGNGRDDSPRFTHVQVVRS